MPGPGSSPGQALVPGIHVFKMRVAIKTWMAGTTLAAVAARPAMTMRIGRDQRPRVLIISARTAVIHARIIVAAILWLGILPCAAQSDFATAPKLSAACRLDS